MLRAQGSFRQDRNYPDNKNIPVQAQFLSLKIREAGEMSVQHAYIFLVTVGNEAYVT